MLGVNSVDREAPQFIFITNENSKKFGLSLIERVMSKDTDVTRFDQFKISGYLLDSKNCIGSNIHMESILQKRLEKEDFTVAEELVKEIYRNKIIKKDKNGDDYFVYQKEKYAQLMRVLPYIVK